MVSKEVYLFDLPLFEVLDWDDIKASGRRRSFLSNCTTPGGMVYSLTGPAASLLISLSIEKIEVDFNFLEPVESSSWK